jgi:RimJ/RimL family protein N-acetyltransferase
MRPEEAEATSELFQAVLDAIPYYNDWAKSSERDRYTAAALHQSTQGEPDSVLVALVGDNIVGFLFSRYDDGVIWLAWFGTALDKRHGGVGSALLAALVESARARKIHKIWCDTRTTNTTSQSVLRNAGFVKLCEVRNHWYGQDFFLWECPVS